jgi:S1-C subfamily serine protease
VSDRPTPVIVYLSGHLRGMTRRLSGDRLRIGTTFGDEIRVMPHELPPGEAETAPGGYLGALELRDDIYELVAASGAEIWVNGKIVERKLLGSGDVLEIGAGGPVLRFRLYGPGSRAYKSMSEVFSDCRDCARHGGRNALQRARILLAGASRELATQTSPWFRATLALLILLIAVTGVLGYRNLRLERRLAVERARIEGLSELLERAERQSLSAEDIARTRRALDERLSGALERVQALESRAGSRERVISMASRSVVFLQGAYGFVESASGRPLRFVPPEQLQPGSQGLQVTLEGDGPLVEVLYTGTAFVATPEGLLLTNRHVALPWEFDPTALSVIEQGFSAVMHRFSGFRPGLEESFDVDLVRASDTADVALLRCTLKQGEAPELVLADVSPRVGEEVIVLGYPTGMQALLARTETSFVEELLASGPLDFWQLAEALSAGGHIAPLATVGIVGQVTPVSVVYDAETTHGGSGGPVLDLDGRVVAVNASIIPEFGGSNLGVPAEQAALLLE